MKPSAFHFDFCLLILLVFSCFKSCEPQDNDNLVTAVVLIRHGARSPLRFFPTDPYRFGKFWPHGLGALSKRGMLDMYNLGKWLRRRYDGFLPRNYDKHDIYVRSTDIDRTIMSAGATLAGLYPPVDTDVWHPQLNWQPIPIHTVPIEDDMIVRNEVPCPKYDQMKEDLWKTEFFVNVNKSLENTYAYLTKHTGRKVASLKGINDVFDSLSIEDYFNMTLPNWTSKVYPEELAPWVSLFFSTDSFTQELARFRSGLLVNEILQHLSKSASNSSKPRYRVKLYSAHDSTLSNLLNAFEALELHQPPFASALIFELKKNSSSYYVNMVYKNSTIPQNLSMKSCDFNCDLENLVEIMKPVAINVDQWKDECGFVEDYLTSNLVLVLIGCVICLSLIGILFIILHIVRGRNSAKKFAINK